MATEVFSLQERIDEVGLITFIEQLVAYDSADEIVIDAVAARVHAASALVALAAMQRRWEGKSMTQGDKTRRVSTLNFEQWPMSPCFKGGSIARGALGEGNALGFTSAICEVRPEAGEVERIASDLAAAVAPDGWAGGPLYPIVQYCFGELLRNCVQHTGEPAFAVVQEHCDALGDVIFVRLAVADCGRGVRLSFVENESPKGSPEMSDVDAILLAIEPRVSSTIHLPTMPYGRSSNMGIGLSMVGQLARATGGYFTIVSGSACLRQTGHASPTGENRPTAWPGCIVSLSLGVEAMTSYLDMLAAARDAIGLTPRANIDRLFL